ncbi:Acyl-CoA:1-acyl-sn-glycerol-3-phosphate acyltransferase [hydrothermal vent metagenome]|uniref:Acyl-CoA:1-acyl-sn-glycerol-3-phosphate acyltransferase n=1 Tax=hydrothermal vent metagenome TaxID=652676 RepID=A0A3B0WAT1_9ZZZZ
MLKFLILAFRSTLFYLGFYFIVILCAIVGILLRPFPLLYRLKAMRFGVKSILICLKSTCNITHKIHGLDALDDQIPSIILSRHESTWEALAFHVIFPLHKDIVKKELKRVPFFGSILTTIESIIIDRSNKIQSLKILKRASAKTLKEGLWVVVFPGGTRVSPGEESIINPGGAILAKQEKSPIYLVKHNAGIVWPKNHFLKKPGNIDVYIKRLFVEDKDDVKALNYKIKDWIDS